MPLQLTTTARLWCLLLLGTAVLAQTEPVPTAPEKNSSPSHEARAQPAGQHNAVAYRQLAATTGFYGCVRSRRVQVIRTGDPGYASVSDRSTYAQLRPSAVVVCRSASDVSAALTCTRSFPVPFVVRSGGHSYAGLSTIGPGGVVIDVAGLETLRIDRSRKQAVVGPGHRLGPLYSALWKSAKLAFPGGFVPSVGLSGLVLGGGYGPYLRTFGVGADSLLAARVVLANGTVVAASQTVNRDLLWALRGGGGNFGVVTELTLKLHVPPPKRTAVTISWAWTSSNRAQFNGLSRQQLIGRVANCFFAGRPAYLPSSVAFARLQIGQIWRRRTPRLWLNFNVNLPKAAALTLLRNKGFLSCAPGSKLQASEQSFGEFIAGNFGGSASSNSRLDNSVASAAGLNSLSVILDRGLDAAGVRELARRAASQTEWWSMFSALGGAAGVEPAGGSAWANHRSQFLVHFQASDRSRPWAEGVLNDVLWPRSARRQYFNYICIRPRALANDPWKLFFGANAQRLRAIKAKYDPRGRFNVFDRPRV